MADPDLPPVVRAVIVWAKDNANVAAEVGTRVSSSLPRSGVTYPWLTISRVTGLPQYPEMPVDFARLQFNAWGGVKTNSLPNWGVADRLARVVTSEIVAFTYAEVTVGGESVALMSMSPLEGTMQLEDPDTGEARFWQDARVTARRIIT